MLGSLLAAELEKRRFKVGGERSGETLCVNGWEPLGKKNKLLN